MVISEPKSTHLREVLLFAFNWKKSATEAHRFFEEVHGDNALSKSQCYRWFKKFQSGDFELDNEPRGKPHQKFEDAELQALLDDDSTQTQEKLAKQLQVSQGSVSLRLNSLRMTQKLSRWVPHELSERQQERRLVTCEVLLARHEKKSFLHRIVTSDEKSIHFSNPMRQKSWGLSGQFPKQTPRPNRLGKKAMLCVWWDQTGVVYFKLLKPGKMVNTSRYEQQMHSLREALNEKRPELREKHNKLILQHDNAPAHNATVVKNTIKDLCWELLPHPPYSPDLVPLDYHLFTSLGHALKNQEFSNSDILRKWLVDWFDSKGIEFFRQGIRKMPERLAPGFHRRVKAKTSFQDDDVPLDDDTTTKPLFTPQENGRKGTMDKVPRHRWNPWQKHAPPSCQSPPPDDERVLLDAPYLQAQEVLVDTGLGRRQDGQGVVLQVMPEDPSLQVRGPLDDECDVWISRKGIADSVGGKAPGEEIELKETKLNKMKYYRDRTGVTLKHCSMAYWLKVITALLIIGCIELNPGPKRQATLTNMPHPTPDQAPMDDLKLLIINLPAEVNRLGEKMDARLPNIEQKMED
ncbi:SETMAR [Cordylochernes scorpioides]|uniref:SETMAR n=1 Tax=Cordylochernes scorpioides TaxID=51811 RepID=A0ABY6KWE4_9ARAC|nr:SETMAR [Cordylochernes scorpioides]